MTQTIGSTTTYHGTEHPYLNGYCVRIVAVIKSTSRPEDDYYSDDYDHIDDEDELALLGGVTAGDRLEVQPWIAEAGRFSFASSDARAVDLELFKHLTTPK